MKPGRSATMRACAGALFASAFAFTNGCALAVAPEFPDAMPDARDAGHDAPDGEAHVGMCAYGPTVVRAVCDPGSACPMFSGLAIRCSVQGRSISLAARGGLGALLFVPEDFNLLPILFTLRRDGTATGEIMGLFSDGLALVGADGQPHVVGLTQEGTYIAYASRDSSGHWSIESVVHPRSTVPGAVSAVAGSNGAPRVLYTLDGDGTSPSIATRSESGTWSSTPVGATTALPMQLDIAPDGNSVVAWVSPVPRDALVFRAWWPLDGRDITRAFALPAAPIERVAVAGVETRSGTDVTAALFHDGARVFIPDPNAGGTYREVLAPGSNVDTSSAACPQGGEHCDANTPPRCTWARAGGLRDGVSLARIATGEVWVAYATLDATVDYDERVECAPGDAGTACRCAASIANERGNNRVIFAAVDAVPPGVRPQFQVPAIPRLEGRTVAIAADGTWLSAVMGRLGGDVTTGDGADLVWFAFDTAAVP